MRKSTSMFVDKMVVKSAAFRELKNHSVKVLMWFYLKRVFKTSPDSKGNKNYHIYNNGEIQFTYSEAEKKGLSRKQFRDSIDDLIAKGFLEVTHQGTGTGDANTFYLCERWQAYGTENFNPALPRRKRTAPGMGWELINARNKQIPSAKNDTRSSVDNDTYLRNGRRFIVPNMTLKDEVINACFR
jgi:hypothetical protein